MLALPLAPSALRRSKLAQLGAQTLAFLVLALSSCRNASNKVVWHEEVRQVQGLFAAELTSDALRELSVQAILPSGERSDVTQFTVNSEQASYRFNVDHNQLIPAPHHTAADTLLLAGDSKLLPARGERFLAEGRFEFVSGRRSDASGSLLYAQVFLPLTRADLWSSGREVVISSRLQLEKVAYQRARVLNPQGEALAGAAVIAFAVDKAFSPERGMVPSWTHDTFRPILARSDAEGRLDLFPLPLAGNYAVLAYADGYCTFVAAAQMSPTATSKEREIVLEPCKGEARERLMARFASTTKTFREELDGKEATLAYINTQKVSLRLDLNTRELPPVSLRIWEGLSREPGSSLILDDPQLKKSANNGLSFQSELEISLPAKFQNNDSLDGDFTIELSLASNDAGAPAERLLLHGRKKGAPPVDAFLDDLVIKSSEQAGVISGQANAQVYISSSFCDDGAALGLKLGEQITFATCQHGQAKIAVSELHLPNASLQIGGQIKGRVFLRDRFDNTTRDDLLNRNEITLFVDYSAPKLQEYPLVLGRDFTVLRKSELAQQNAAPANQAVIVSPATLSEFALRFLTAERCTMASGDKGDGVVFGRQGLGIGHFAVSPQPNPPPADRFALCSKDGKPQALALQSSDIVFPQDPDANAVFYLSVKDLAGNLSGAVLYEIPSCTANPQGLCWQP